MLDIQNVMGSSIAVVGDLYLSGVWWESILLTGEPEIELELGYYPYPEYEPMAFWGDGRKYSYFLRSKGYSDIV